MIKGKYFQWDGCTFFYPMDDTARELLRALFSLGSSFKFTCEGFEISKSPDQAASSSSIIYARSPEATARKIIKGLEDLLKEWLAQNKSIKHALALSLVQVEY